MNIKTKIQYLFDYEFAARLSFMEMRKEKKKQQRNGDRIRNKSI